MKTVFGGIISFVLLGLYASSVIVAIVLVMSHVPNPDTAFTEGFRLAMTTIGALVSALVIAVLAATDAGETPLVESMNQQDFTPRQVKVVKVAVLAYLGVWMLCGLGAFVVGVMIQPDALKSLNDHGKAWIGLAVATGYAYFGLKPTSKASVRIAVAHGDGFPPSQGTV
ncbi:hypothetical protein [Planctellipticum variicoloris]|uniref:hypothetical protein n=1 Tax=Planctellipticum variicoloris TaxID=3064265 RepID=UPI0030139F05|nr:hypothetical protein SH412_005321 [Planctomycetaceae bacterium SH412]